MLLLDTQIQIVGQTQLLIWCSYEVDRLNLTIIKFIQTCIYSQTMLLSQLWLLLKMKISMKSNISLQKTVKKKLNSSRKSWLLSKKLTFQIYWTLANLKKLLTRSHQVSILHGTRIANMSKSQNIPRAGGIKNVIAHWSTTGQQEVWKIGKCSRVKSSLLNVISLIQKFKKLLIKDMVLGNSWTGSTSANYPLLKLLNITVNNFLN